MELVLTLAALYAIECLRLLPVGGAVFDVAAGGFRVRIWRGPGWRFLSPLPFTLSYLGSRLPLVEGEDGLRGASRVSRFAFAPEYGRGRRFTPHEVRSVDLRGRLVRVDGQAFARAISRKHAAELARLLGDGRVVDDAWSSRLARELAATHDLERFRQERQRFEAATGPLRWVTALYFASLFVALPLWIWGLTEERGLLLGAPIAALLHVAALVCLQRAHRRLLPEARSERTQILFACAVYPPALLRGPQALCSALCSGFHPAVLACALLGEEDRREHLRAELARLVYRDAPTTAPRAELSHQELQALERLLEEVGESRQSLLAPPVQTDPVAESYCPMCLAEYRAGRACSDCRTGLSAYPTAL